MAIATTVNVLPAQLWPQRDARDPLGIWNFRLGVIGDATGGGITTTVQAPADRRSSYVYTLYSVNVGQLTGSQPATSLTQIRLLTNWPDADTVAGVQAYASSRIVENDIASPFTGQPSAMRGDNEFVSPAERFVLLFDPRQSGGVLSLVELTWDDNVDLATYIFEGYGYFWDRSVLNTPGGPRHPGSS